MKLGDAEGEIVLNDLPGFVGAHSDATPNLAGIGNLLTQAIGNAISGTIVLGNAIGQGLAEAIKNAAEAMAAIFANPDYGQVPSYARKVRPVGGKSNSKDWLAWDERQARWRPCYRVKGDGWWWT